MFRTAEMSELAPRIEIGQRYRKTDSAWVTWEVTEIGPIRDGIRHYRIADVADRSNVKLISERTLTDAKSYRPIASDR